MTHCINVQLHKYSTTQMSNHTNVEMYKCPITQMTNYTNVPSYKCLTTQMSDHTNAPLHNTSPISFRVDSAGRWPHHRLLLPVSRPLSTHSWSKRKCSLSVFSYLHLRGVESSYIIMVCWQYVHLLSNIVWFGLPKQTENVNSGEWSDRGCILFHTETHL